MAVGQVTSIQGSKTKIYSDDTSGYIGVNTPVPQSQHHITGKMQITRNLFGTSGRGTVDPLTLIGNDMGFNGSMQQLVVNSSFIGVSGIEAGFEGQIIYFFCRNGSPFEFKHQSTLSLAANRINCGTTGTSVFIANGEWCSMVYSGSRWNFLSRPNRNALFTTAVSTTITSTEPDLTYLVNNVAAAVTITLPTASSDGQRIKIKRYDSTSVGIITVAAQTIVSHTVENYNTNTFGANTTITFDNEQTFQYEKSTNRRHLVGRRESPSIKTITATYTILPSDRILIINNGATGITITLPDPTIYIGMKITFARGSGSTGSVTITAGGATVVQSLTVGTLGATTTLGTIGTYGGRATYQSNGTNWYYVG